MNKIEHYYVTVHAVEYLEVLLVRTVNPYMHMYACTYVGTCVCV